MIAVWKSLDANLERSLVLNEKLLRDVQSQKAQSKLRFLSLYKVLGIIAFVLWLFVLATMIMYAINNYSSTVIFFLVSAITIFIVNVKGLSDYIRHIVMIHRIDYSKSIVEIQHQLAELEISIINHSKVMVLQFPFFTTFYLNNSIIENATWWYWLFQVVLTGSFIIASYWLFRNLKLENKDKTWFKHLVVGSGGKSVMDAMEFFNELEEFQQSK